MPSLSWLYEGTIGKGKIMAYPIKTKEYHESELAEIRKRAAQRRERGIDEIDDRELSYWSENNMVSYHLKALSVIEAGMKSKFWALFEGDREVDAKIGSGEWGPFWKLGESETALIERRGKRYLPTGKKSRILKSLGLEERLVEKPVMPFFDARCSFIGAPVSFHTIQA